MSAVTARREDIVLEEGVDRGGSFSEPVVQTVWHAALYGALSTGEHVSMSRSGSTYIKALDALEDALEANGWTVRPARRRGPGDARPVATEDMLERHTEKQGCSWGDAWNYFRDQGYNVDGLEYFR